MTKAEAAYLANVYSSQRNGRLYAITNRHSERLEEQGYILKISRVVGKDREGIIKVEGFGLTLAGILAYCKHPSAEQRNMCGSRIVQASE